MDLKLFYSFLFAAFLFVVIRKLASGMTENTQHIKSPFNVSHNFSQTFVFSLPIRESESGNNSKAVLTQEENYLNLLPETWNSTDTLNNSTHSADGTNITLTQNGTFFNSTHKTVKEVNYTKLGIENLEEAERILNSGVWNFDRRTADGDSIFTRKLADGRNVLRLTGVVNMPADELFFILYNGLDDYPKWNPSFVECRILKKIDDHTDISYQVSASAARGYVSSRDFITLRYWIKRDKNYLSGTSSVDYPESPESLEYTRGYNGPGCWELRPMKSNPNNTEFRWLLNTKLNGWIPQILQDNAFKKFMTKYMVFLRQYCDELKEKKAKISTS